MGNFALDTKGRAWMVTVQIANMEIAEWPEEDYKKPEWVAEQLIQTWENSGKGRTAAVSVCVSLQGLYHCHCALYGNTTTLKHVKEIMFKSHTEPQLGGKKALKGYLLKEPPYDEKGEMVLYTAGLENVQNLQGQRSDIAEIEALLEQGLKPSEIMETSFSFRKYEKMIRSAYIDKRIKETPLVQEKHVVWHVGESGSGKTYSYITLCEERNPDDIYLLTDYENGGFDSYVDNGCPSVLFMDEFKGNLKYGTLLVILDKYTRAQIHSRYQNTPCLWSEVHITSIYPPEEAYSFMVEDSKRNRDKITQLLRRITEIKYHYKLDNEYKTFSLPASEYTNYADLKEKALKTEHGFQFVLDAEKIPF